MKWLLNIFVVVILSCRRGRVGEEGVVGAYEAEGDATHDGSSTHDGNEKHSKPADDGVIDADFEEVKK